MKAKIFILLSIFFLVCIPTPLIADSAPDFEYTVDKAGVLPDLLPYMTLFEGKWKGGPDYKLVVTSFKGEKATITYGWGSWRGNKSGFKTRKVKFNPKKKKLSYRVEGRGFYLTLDEEDGMPVIKGKMVTSQFNDHITMRPVEPKTKKK